MDEETFTVIREAGEVQIVGVGEAGPPGPAGPPGEPGAPGGTFLHQQETPAAEWGPITHGLGYHPAVTVTDSAGLVHLAEVEHLDVNTAVIRVSPPYGGRADFS